MCAEMTRPVIAHAGDSVFSLSTALIVKSKERILICRTSGGSTWNLPQATVEFNEAASEGISRYFREELSLPVVIGPLKIILERFSRSALKSKHETVFYFEEASSSIADYTAEEINLKASTNLVGLEFRWIDRAGEQLILFDPPSLLQGLFSSEGGIIHAVYKS